MRTIAPALAALILGSMGQQTPTQAQNTYPLLSADNLQQISPHVHAIKGWPNVGFIIGERAVLVVDTGLGPRNGAITAQTAKHLSPGSEFYLTTTHYHPEHAMGAGGFPAETKTIRCEIQQRELDEAGLAILVRFQSRPAFAPFLQDVHWERADILFDTNYTLDLGGVTAELMCLGNTHTKGDMEIFVPEDSVLFSGDVVMKKLFPSFRDEGGSLAEWIAVIDQLAALEPNIVLPTHGDFGGGELIGVYRAFMLDLQENILTLKAAGKNEDETTMAINAAFAEKYPDWYIRGLDAAITATYAQND